MNQKLEIHHISGIGESTARQLAEHRLDTVQKLASATVEQIATVPGFGPVRAVAVRRAAQSLLESFQASAANEANVDTAPDRSPVISLEDARIGGTSAPPVSQIPVSSGTVFAETVSGDSGPVEILTVQEPGRTKAGKGKGKAASAKKTKSKKKGEKKPSKKKSAKKAKKAKKAVKSKAKKKASGAGKKDKKDKKTTKPGKKAKAGKKSKADKKSEKSKSKKSKRAGTS